MTRRGDIRHATGPARPATGRAVSRPVAGGAVSRPADGHLVTGHLVTGPPVTGPPGAGPRIRSATAVAG